MNNITSKNSESPTVLRVIQARIEQLEEAPLNFQPYTHFEIYGDNQVVHDDLVFVLGKNPKKCQVGRPYVVEHRGKLKVIGHRAFYRAAKEAGLETIPIDMIFQDADKELCIEKLAELGISFMKRKDKQTMPNEERFLFFRDNDIPRNVRGALEKHPSYVSGVFIYPQNGCVRFTLEEYRKKRFARRELEIMKEVTRQNRLRSLDGVRPEGYYSRFVA